MKSHKSILLNEIINEIDKQIILFKPEIPLIKKRIEGLIEKEYVKRDSENL